MTDGVRSRSSARALPLLAAVAVLVLPAAAQGATRTTWVDPVRGSDAASGARRGAALRTLTAAWGRASGPTRILITSGRLGPEAVPTYFERKRRVTIAGLGRVTLPPLNIYRVRRLRLQNLTILGDVHCESCVRFRLQRVRIRGRGRVQEGLKVNQSAYVVVERSNISGAQDNAIDFVAVQHALIRRSRVHDAGDWCMYAKGGSAYVRVVGNRIYRCGTGGFSAGQGTGGQFMVFPWVRYEAYDVRVWNNRITDTEGAGLGVNGGFDVLFASNTLRRVGSRSHALEVVFGLRSCDGRAGDEGRSRCQTLLDRGGWGTTRVDDGTNAVRIPNRHVWFYDNLISRARGSARIDVAADYGGPSREDSGAPSPARAGDDLRLVGNVFGRSAHGRLAHRLPRFGWAGAGLGAPRPRSLSNARLPGLPSVVGSDLR